MSGTRYVHQAKEKVDAICTFLRREGALEGVGRNALAALADIPFSTLKSATTTGRFSAKVESGLAKIARFDPEHHSWVDEAIPEGARRLARSGDYAGRDTVERFRAALSAGWGGTSPVFRSSRRAYRALDPHMHQHDIGDLGQATADGSDMQFFLTARFDPFFHPSGIMFGFSKAVLSVEIESRGAARATRCLGQSEPIRLSDAVLSGGGTATSLRWTLERSGGAPAILHGEYSTVDDPLFAVADVDGESAITSCVEVNLYDRATFGTDATIQLGGNKQALIEHIFSTELDEACSRRGWIVLSEQSSVIARYDR